MERSRSPLFRRLASGSLLILLAFSFVLVIAVPPPVHAAAVIGTASFHGAGASGSFAFTVGHNIDIIALGIQLGDDTAGAASSTYVTSVSDSLGNIWIMLAESHTIIAQTVPSGTCSVNFCLDDEIWYTVSGLSGADTITVNFATATTTSTIQALDIVGAGRPTQPYQIDYCTVSVACVSHTNLQTAGGTLWGAQDVLVGSVWTNCAAGSSLTPGNISEGGFTNVGASAVYNGDTEYALNQVAAGAPAEPSHYPWTCVASQNTWIALGVNFPSGGASTVTSTVTQTATTGTSTQGGGTISGSSQYINSDTLYWNPGQNLIGTTATVTNVTAKLSAVHIASATASVYLVTYAVSAAANGAPPSSSQPLQIWFSHQFTVTNGSGAQLLSVVVPPSVTVCGYCYYAIAIQTNGNHSNSASVTNSGINVNEATAFTGTWYQFATGGNVIPINVYFGTAAPNGLYVHMGLSWPVGITTVTSSTTSTVYSAVSTLTVSTTINQAGIQTNVDLYLALAIIGGLFLIMAKVGGIAGAMFGAIIGEIICIVGGIITGGLADVSLVATVVGCLAMIYMGRSSGGGGGV